jgi:hypothetical protein
MAIVTPAILIDFYDETIVADLVSDDGLPEPDLATNAKLLRILNAAEGRLESACTVANIYTPTELAALTGTSLALAEELISGLAMAALLRRRGTGKYSEIKERVDDCEDFLDRLRKGERLFGGESDAREAGLPSVDGPTIATYRRLNMLPDRVGHFYPNRSSRLPIGRG